MNKFLYWFLMIMVLIIINSASIFWIVANFVWAGEYETTIGNKVITFSYSYFDTLANTHKALVFLFMGVGFVLSVMLVKWLFVDTLTQIREKAKEKKKDLYKKFRKEIDNAC